jgi:hypothetical protein
MLPMRKPGKVLNLGPLFPGTALSGVLCVRSLQLLRSVSSKEATGYPGRRFRRNAIVVAILAKQALGAGKVI